MGLKQKLAKAVIKRKLKKEAKKAGHSDINMSDDQLDSLTEFATDPKNMPVFEKFKKMQAMIDQKVKEKGINQMAAAQQVMRENPALQQELAALIQQNPEVAQLLMGFKQN